MKFLVDAQLSRKLCVVFRDGGHDAIHTLDMPERNKTSDRQVLERADADERVVVSKDVDFLQSHILFGRPKRLLLVSTGNCSNAVLSRLLTAHLPTIVRELDQTLILELSSNGLIVR